MAARYFGSLRGLLLVSAPCSLAIGSAVLFKFKRDARFRRVTTTPYLTSVLIGYLNAIGVGMLLPLVFAVYQLRPVGDPTQGSDDPGHPVHAPQHAVDSRFGQG